MTSPSDYEKGNPLLRKNRKPMFRISYSILQDELFNYMMERGFKGFQRGEYGSTAAKLFIEKVKQLFSFKEAQERAEKEAREKERQERIKARRNKRGMER